MGIKVFFLKLFGAKIGKGLVIKNNVNIKFLETDIRNDVWLGENAWIDNLDEVIIGNNVCISQGALLPLETMIIHCQLSITEMPPL